MGIMNEDTLKFLMGWFLRGSYGEGLCQFILTWYQIAKEAGGRNNFQVPKSFFRCRHSKQSYRQDIPPCQGLKVHFGVVLGCKGGGGKKKLFRPRKVFLRRRHSKQSYRPDIPPCHRLIFFWRGIMLQRRQGEEKNFCGPDFFRCRHTKQSYRPDIPPCQGLKVYFGVVLGCKGGVGKKQFFQAPNRFFRFTGPKQGSTGKTSHDKPNTRQGQHLKSDGLQ